MRIANQADRLNRPSAGKWAASWAAAMQGPAPSGVPSALPDLSLALPGDVARDQTFRMVIRPDLWGRAARVRFSNAFGDRPIRIDGVHAGLHIGSGVVAPDTNTPIAFAGGSAIDLPPGEQVLSDPFPLSFVTDPLAADLLGRRLAVSFHVVGASGPLTWHAKAMTTSYLSPPGTGALGDQEDNAAFPCSTTGWYLLDGLDVEAPADAVVVACLGDSITDGTFSTLNGDDRWTDRFSHRLHAAYGARAAAVNVGIGANQVTGPKTYSAAAPFNGGPSALDRLERDVLSRAGLTHVIWVEGVNDFGQAFAPEGTPSASAEEVIAGLSAGAERMRAQGLKVAVGALPPSLNAVRPIYGSAETDRRRRAVNEFLRTSDAFDAFIDFEAATMDPETGEIRKLFQPDSTLGLPADLLHPNRAGYLAMGEAVDLAVFDPDRP